MNLRNFNPLGTITEALIWGQNKAACICISCSNEELATGRDRAIREGFMKVVAQARVWIVLLGRNVVEQHPRQKEEHEQSRDGKVLMSIWRSANRTLWLRHRVPIGAAWDLIWWSIGSQWRCGGQEQGLPRQPTMAGRLFWTENNQGPKDSGRNFDISWTP